MEANMDCIYPKVWGVLAKKIIGNSSTAYNTYQPVSFIFSLRTIPLVTGIKTYIRKRNISLWDKIMHRKRCIIKTNNYIFNNTA